MAKVTKEDLVEAIVKAIECTKKDGETAINTVIAEITKDLKMGKDVVLTGFGSFTVSKRAARMGRNPQTGAAIKIAAKKVPRFKAGKGLKDAVK
ncbi:MAG: HU family DNA-binding protein [Candidatus Gribaldobacteria bacterium]|nr:HU family DNA-binding protein [Candidatus Gribaldobacteria bacterium]